MKNYQTTPFAKGKFIHRCCLCKAAYFNLHVLEENIQVRTVDTSRTIKGQVAFRGMARGPVVVVRNKAELAKVTDGSILISHSTTVDYVPVLKRVKAIVTEEGGVLSHASVISRELHIPCIIDTKIATQVLKDGDLVEVDAEKGVVRVVERVVSR